MEKERYLYQYGLKENEEKEKQQTIEKLVKLRNSLNNVKLSFRGKSIPLMAMDLKFRKPFLKVEELIREINELLEAEQVPYDINIVNQKEFLSMNDKEKHDYIIYLEKNPDRMRKLISEEYEEMTKNKNTYQYAYDKFICPNCKNSNLYKGNSNSITLATYSTKEDKENFYPRWHEDKFCKHCGFKYTIINGC